MNSSHQPSATSDFVAHADRLEEYLEANLHLIGMHDDPRFAMRRRALVYCDENSVAPDIEDYLHQCVDDWAAYWFEKID